MTIEKQADFMSFYVRASSLKNGKPAARHLLVEGMSLSITDLRQTIRVKRALNAAR
jgi:hypothetical protein